ncbi:hypothetical protein V2J09_014258 [Rumex salicifolius]
MATLSLLSSQILAHPHKFISFSAYRLNSINFHSRKATKIFLRSRSAFAEEEDDADSSNSNSRVEGAIELFNNREYYACHDVFENLWYRSSDPTRTLFHALLQCAVGFHHLFNQNHKGAMMELGEAICALQWNKQRLHTSYSAALQRKRRSTTLRLTTMETVISFSIQHDLMVDLIHREEQGFRNCKQMESI